MNKFLKSSTELRPQTFQGLSNPIKREFYLYITVLFGVVAAFLTAYFHFEVYQLSKENSLLENLQALICGVIFFAFLWSFKKAEGHIKLLLLFFSFLGFAFVLRELDVEKFDLPSIIIFWGSGTGRNGLLAVMFSITLFLYLKRFPEYFDVTKSFFKGLIGKLVLLSGFVLVFSEIVEKHMAWQHHVMIEETLELVGFSIFLIAGLLSRHITCRYKF
jgi:hypothetical protein